MDVAIDAVRTFNRFFSRHVGAMDARFLGSDANLAEARLLFEIARQEPVSAMLLQAELDLDRGYLSRVIARLEQRGWLRRDRLESDARTRPISLTEAGRRAFEQIDRRQRAAVADDLGRLTAAEQDELVRALTTARSLLDRSGAAAAPALHVLDRPVWHALRGRQAYLAEGDDAGLRLAPDHGPFVAAAEPRDLRGLLRFAAQGELWVVEKQAITPPAGLRIARQAECVQMVARSVTDAARAHVFCELGEADAPEMFALASLTRPGPFANGTHRLGRFVGIRVQGRLVAMAGERMKPGHFTEVSGVCTHPDHRGHGYAGFLMRQVVAGILARGEVPFLHCYATNQGAIALYRSLGFELHQSVTATVLVAA